MKFYPFVHVNPIMGLTKQTLRSLKPITLSPLKLYMLYNHDRSVAIVMQTMCDCFMYNICWRF